MNENTLTPPGTYRARAVDAQLGETSSGKEQVAISFQLLHPGFEGQHLAYYGSFSERALPITLKALRACGWVGNDLADLTGIGSSEVNLVVEHEEYEGRIQARVRWVNSIATGLVKKQLDPTAAKAFAARMRGAIAALEAGSAPAPQAQPRPAQGARPVQRQPQPPPRMPEPPPHTDDDMPF